MRCKFCFATFQDVKQTILPKGHLNKEQSIEVIYQLADIGFEKITFAGGEPTLCPWLPELIKTAKDLKMTTMIVTNGSKLSDHFLEQVKDSLDWIALSVDSLNQDTNLATGRAITGKRALTLDYYKELTQKIKHFGFGLKINTVVSSKNYSENMTDFIRFAKPLRWKIFQVLPIKGQNDKEITEFIITDEQFKQFLATHEQLSEITTLVPENNSEMKGTYAMVDPAGRFYDNKDGQHHYSRPILEIGSRLAIQQVRYSFIDFVKRGGIYDWSKPKYYKERFTMSGEALSGKSNIAKIIADKLNYKFVSIGKSIREITKQNDKTIVEFTNSSHYDLIVNTSDFQNQYEVADFIISVLNKEGLI